MLINLTPHKINLFLTNGEEEVFPPSGIIARCSTEQQLIRVVDGIPVYRSTFGEVQNLPEPQTGITYIVSMLVAQAAKHRDDLVCPNDTVRDEQGRIIGCKSFCIP